MANTVGEWNEMIAAFAGKLEELKPEGTGLIAPIKDYDDYEHLEARGREKRRGDDSNQGHL